MIVIPAFVGLAIATPSLLWVGIGERWGSQHPAGADLRLRIYRLLARIFLRPCDHSTGPPRGQASPRRLRPVFDPVVSILVGVRYGIAGVALGVAATQVIFYGVELTVLRRMVQFSVPAYLGEALKPGLRPPRRWRQQSFASNATMGATVRSCRLSRRWRWVSQSMAPCSWPSRV